MYWIRPKNILLYSSSMGACELGLRAFSTLLQVELERTTIYAYFRVQSPSVELLGRRDTHLSWVTYITPRLKADGFSFRGDIRTIGL